MRFGVCTSVANAGMLKAAGWDYVEENVQGFLRAEVGDAEWEGERVAKDSPLPVEAGNVLVPARLRITGESADRGALKEYMERVMVRAEKVGMRTLVLGSGKAREVAVGFDREEARRQMVDFARMSAEIAGEHGVVLVMEPLNKGECNFVNSVAEGMEYVRAVGHPHFQCLVDSYHFWEEAESLESLRAAMPWIQHVHVADRGGRLAPGQTAGVGEAEYLAFFKALKAGGYDGRVSVEGKWEPAMTVDAEAVLRRLKGMWERA